MKTKIMYVADDGTAFTSSQKCIDYEKSLNKYTVFYKDEETSLFSQNFNNEAEAKRFIADSLHDCYKDGLTATIKLLHLGNVVEFSSTEIGEVVPAHLKINGAELDKVFQKVR